MEIAYSRAISLRALLTEVLPYELPIEMTTHWFFDWIESRLVTSSRNKVVLKPRTSVDSLVLAFIQPPIGGLYPDFDGLTVDREYSIRQDRLVGKRYAPAEFTVRRDKTRLRDISYLGLSSQLSISFLYSAHKDALLYYSTRDRSSLRHPARVNAPGKHVRSRSKTKLGGEEITVETTGRRLGTYNSYFVYENYAFVGQFYDSKRWHALEAHWNCMRRLDVSNCFKSIYTHSFAWSTGTDAHSKNHIQSTTPMNQTDLGRAFDRVMQVSNWGETNGIPIGPESSRIFAEIIFQKIDSEIKTKLAQKNLTGHRYEYLRYVDDYFIFTNDQYALDRVSSVIEETLRVHGFSLNPLKSKDYATPFTTNISSKKASLKTFLKQSLPYKGKLPKFDSREISVHLKTLLIESDNDSATVGTSLSQIERRLKSFIAKRALRCRDLKSSLKLVEYTWSFIHNALYQYLSHPSVASAMKMVRLLRGYHLSPELFELSSRDRNVLKFKVQEDCHFAITRALKRLLEVESTEVEICHFLSLASACNIDLASKDLLVEEISVRLNRNIYDRKSPRSNQSHIFLMLSVIKYYFGSHGNSVNVTSGLIDSCISLSQYLLADDFIPKRYIRMHAAQELFVLGIISCPYVGVDDKVKILNRPWLENFLGQTVQGIGASPGAFVEFLRRCSADSASSEAGLSIFAWNDDEFDGVLYEKEPQFIY